MLLKAQLIVQYRLKPELVTRPVSGSLEHLRQRVETIFIDFKDIRVAT